MTKKCCARISSVQPGKTWTKNKKFTPTTVESLVQRPTRPCQRRYSRPSWLPRTKRGLPRVISAPCQSAAWVLYFERVGRNIACRSDHQACVQFLRHDCSKGERKVDLGSIYGRLSFSKGVRTLNTLRFEFTSETVVSLT